MVWGGVVWCSVARLDEVSGLAASGPVLAISLTSVPAMSGPATSALCHPAAQQGRRIRAGLGGGSAGRGKDNLPGARMAMAEKG